MAVVEIVYSDANDESRAFSLFHQVEQTPVAQRWLEYLEEELRGNTSIEQHIVRDQLVRGHFVGLPHTGRDRASLARYMNDCIAKVNAHAPAMIDERADALQGPENLNRLHKHFEILRGPILAPAAFFLDAPPSVRKALVDLNDLIHEFEEVIRLSAPGHDSAGPLVAMIFEGQRVRHDLKEEDFEQFRVPLQFGDLCVHYCEVGKGLLDVYRARDTMVGEENIRPLRYISASFDCYLGSDWSEEQARRHAIDFEHWLRENGYDPADKHLSLGNIVLAHLIRDDRLKRLSRDEVLTWLSQHANVRQIVLHR